jgi:glutathione peroxidase
VKDSIREFVVLDSARKPFDFSSAVGDVLLIVNTASQCGFTPQYAGLEELFEKYKGRGFRVLAFPCNQFGNQEPGTNEEIARFCEQNYSVSFPVMDKIKVNGEGESPLFAFLKSKAPGLLATKAIKWNFTKFLVSRDGKMVQRFAPTTTPQQMTPAIEEFLAAAAP